MRKRHAVPVIAIALSLALLTLGSSSAGVQEPDVPSSASGVASATRPAAPRPDTSRVPRTKPPDKPSEPPKAPATTAATPRTDPITPESAAVDVVADQLNGRAFERALDEPEFTESSPGDAWQIVSGYWDSSSLLWEELTDRLRLKTRPLTFRPLTYNELYEDEEETGCAYLNQEERVVASGSPAPFFCAADSPGGKLYWPVKGMEQRWAESDLSDGTVIRGYAIWLNQLYGQYVAFAVYNTHSPMLGAEGLIHPMYDMSREAGFCFAGAAMQASFFDRKALLAGMELIYPNESERKKYEAALAYGFDANDLGKCVAEYWPRTV